MALGSLRTLALELNLDAHGLPATVTRPAPDNAPITTSGIWLRPEETAQPFGTERRRHDPRKILVLPKSAVVDAPRGTTIVIAEQFGEDQRSWVVEGYAPSGDVDHHRVIVTPAP